VEKAFEFTAAHQLAVWYILCIYVAVFALLAGLVLRGINKERGNRDTIF
jgi:hypothetical protein